MILIKRELTIVYIVKISIFSGKYIEYGVKIYISYQHNVVMMDVSFNTYMLIKIEVITKHLKHAKIVI